MQNNFLSDEIFFLSEGPFRKQWRF